MNTKILDSFSSAACKVLFAETALTALPGMPVLSERIYLTDEVTVIISLVGDINGTALFSMKETLALDLIKQLLGEPALQFNSLAQSGIAELCNVIAGQASATLAPLGCHLTISPPTMLLGTGTALSTLDLPRWVVPLQLPSGAFSLHLATSNLNWTTPVLNRRPTERVNVA